MHRLDQLEAFTFAHHRASTGDDSTRDLKGTVAPDQVNGLRSNTDYRAYSLVPSGTYRTVKQDIAKACTTTRAGGIVAGPAYFDGILEGQVCGTKTAVNEIADELRLQIRLTLDRVAGWWFVRPDRQARGGPAPEVRIALLSAYDVAQAGLAAVSAPNKRRYCERHGYTYVEHRSGFDPARPPAWSKILFMRELLQQFDWVFWSDVDSLIMNGELRLEDVIWAQVPGNDEGYHVILPHDEPGGGVSHVNTGSWLVKNSEWSREFLDEVWAHDEFINDRLWENRAIIHLLHAFDLSDYVRIVAQRHLNSYPRTYRKGDFVLHFPDRPTELRERMMRVALQFSTCEE